MGNLMSWLRKHHLQRKPSEGRYSSAFVIKEGLWNELWIKLMAVCKTLALITNAPWCELLGDIILTACGYWPKTGKFNHEKENKWCNGGGGKASYENRCIKNTMCRETSSKLNIKNLSRLNWNYMWLKTWWYSPLQKCYNYSTIQYNTIQYIQYNYNKF